MTTTLTTATTSTDTLHDGAASARRPKILKTAAAAAGTAAVATTAIAAMAHAAGVSFETEPGKAIPLLGFAQLTIFFVAIGALIARAMGRRASHPQRTFVRTTVVLTALSLVPDVTLGGVGVSTKLTLMATHVVAAAIVIPWLATRLPE